MVLTDEQWAVLEPLVEACRRLRKCRRATCGRRSLPISDDTPTARNGMPFPRSSGRDGCRPDFIRWSCLGVWQRLLALAQQRGVELGMAFLDGTLIRAHQKAAGAAKKTSLRRNRVLVRRLAALVAAMAPRPV